jgi:hypothetical protein
MPEKNDWREGMRGSNPWLKGVKLHWMTYKKPSDTGDHDHCSFCWVRFIEADDVIDSDDFITHEGYTTLDDYHWVCNDCLGYFKDEFEWVVTE